MPDILPFDNYRVLFTPLISSETYGDTVDVTQDIDLTDFIQNIGSLRREIDNGDYDIGIFTFGDITITAINQSRRFNSPRDAKSIFKFRRDRCRVDIKFFDDEGNETTTFRGLINDDATRIDFERNNVRFRVLSVDSIFRQVNVPSGSIVDGDLFSTAINRILNLPEITATLSYDPANVQVDLDLQIDVGEVFSSISTKDALDMLMLVSNSILYVDKENVVRVHSRRENAQRFDFYGPSDLFGRPENILRVRNYNTGVQRALSSIRINEDTIVENPEWQEEYGFREKEITIDFINDSEKEEEIANRLIRDFSVPKPELEITVLSTDVVGVELLDLVSISYDYRYTPSDDDERLPMWGQVQWGEFRWPAASGSFKILPKEKWKVISINEDLQRFRTRLKLRQTGIEEHDGVFV